MPEHDDTAPPEPTDAELEQLGAIAEKLFEDLAPFNPHTVMTMLLSMAVTHCSHEGYDIDNVIGTMRDLYEQADIDRHSTTTTDSEEIH